MVAFSWELGSCSGIRICVHQITDICVRLLYQNIKDRAGPPSETKLKCELMFSCLLTPQGFIPCSHAVLQAWLEGLLCNLWCKIHMNFNDIEREKCKVPFHTACWNESNNSLGILFKRLLNLTSFFCFCFFFTSSNVTTRKKLLYSYWATLLTYLFKKFTVSVCVYVCSHDGCKWDAIPHRRRGGQGTTL